MIDFNTYRPLNFSSCLNPQKVIIDGQPQLCRCGKCLACVQSYRNHTASNLQSEVNNWKHCIFFTLTYSPDFCPSAKIVWFNEDSSYHILLLGRSKDLLKNSNSIPYRIYFSSEHDSYMVDYVDSDGVISSTDCLPPDFIPYLHNARFKNSFGILCYRDVQLWRKRFIKSYFKYVKKSYPEVFANGTPQYRLYYCGEYGTKFFRPHFHLLFMYDDEKLVANLGSFRNYVFQSWSNRKRISGGHNLYEIQPFADFSLFSTQFELQRNPNFSFIESNQSISSYVSSYVCSGSKLPLVLSFKPWRPKTVSPCGKYGSFGTRKTDCDEVIEKVKKCFAHETSGRSLVDFFGRMESRYNQQKQCFETISIPYSNSVLCSLFRKPYGYNLLSNFNFQGLLSQFLSCVTREFYRLRKEFGYPKITDFDNFNRYLLAFTYHRKFKQVMFNSVFREWLTLRDCCSFVDDHVSPSKVKSFNESTWLFLRNAVRTMIRYNMSVSQYMTLFNYFWRCLVPQIRLSRFYSEQQYFVEHGISPKDLLIFYDFLPDYSLPWSPSWYLTFGIHYPWHDSKQDSDLSILFNNYVYNKGSWILSNIHQRNISILFTHFKHHLRSDF